MPEDASQTLVESAYFRLRRDIIQGRLPPNTKLRISELKKMYEMGASPLREALNRLVSESFVVSLIQRGFYVAPFSIEELKDLTATRILIETEALRHSIADGDDEWEAGIVGAFHKLSKVELADTIDPEDRELRNRDFHNAVLAACPLKKLLHLHEILYDQHERYRIQSLKLTAQTRDLHGEHRAIMEAALARDFPKAAEATRLHIQSTADIMERRLSEIEKSA